jgi:hypothetical protein
MKPRPFLIVLSVALSGGSLGCDSQTSDNFQNPPQGPPSTCAATAVNQCSGGSVEYACSKDRPDDGDTNLVCDEGTPAALGMTSYCCAPYGQYWSDCTVDSTIVGCPAAAFGFLCMGLVSPAQADTSLTCSAGTAVSGGTTYCCNSEVLPDGCAADGTVSCSGNNSGYSCAAGQTPQALDPSLACIQAGDSVFCCATTS